jgi:hypothetical protein
MNPETLYPEIKDMKDNEIFVERAKIVIYITQTTDQLIRLPINKIILKKDKAEFVKDLKDKYNANKINLITIEK